MKAYKFRSATNFEFISDIIVHKRLHCAPPSILNDLLEGDLRHGVDRGRELEVINFGQAVSREIDSYRICALSTTFDSHLLWAYYAAGFSGLAIEIDLPESDLTPVEYSDSFIYTSELIDTHTAPEAAKRVLSRKSKRWIHEKEVRIITKSQFYSLPNAISRVIVGSRMSPSMMTALYVICSNYKIGLDRVILADWGMYTMGFQPNGLEH